MMKNRVKVHLIQAKQHTLEGNRNQALDSIRKALAVDPGEILITEVLISMERADINHDQHEDSNSFGTAVQQPTLERNQIADMDSKLAKIFRLSDEALASENGVRALAYLKKAVQLFPEEPEANRKLQQLQDTMKAGDLIKIGLKKLSEGDTVKAIAASRKAFNLMPGVNGLEELLSRIERVKVKGSTPEATPVIEEKLTPGGEAQLWADRIRTAVKDDNFEEAGKMVAEAVKRHPEDTLLNSFHSKLKRLGFVT
ncbi:MAG: hypothetical protein K8S62_12705 [Candidatus Sabulitectum sp.]|nr:hypothetical protein [Candidatus Sabulitectum sp.]